ncbi:MAG: pyocin knob domain-containing protein, partial [Aeromonas hydrophila]
DPANNTVAMLRMEEQRVILSSRNRSLVWDGEVLSSALGRYTLESFFNGKIPTQAINIPSGADLNDYQTPGFYSQSSNANATAGLNYPRGVAGSLLVKQTAGIVQEYHCYQSSEIYTRAFYSNKWSDWVRQYNTAFIPTPADVGALALNPTNGAGQKVTGPLILEHDSGIRVNSTNGQYGFRLVNSGSTVYLQGGKTDQDETDQRMVISGQYGKGLSFFRLSMRDGAHPCVNQAGVDYQIYHRNNKPTAADCKALPDHGFGMGSKQAAAVMANSFTEDGSRDFNKLLTAGEYTVDGSWLNGYTNVATAVGHSGLVKVEVRHFGSGPSYVQTFTWVVDNNLARAVRYGTGAKDDITWSMWKRFSSHEIHTEYRMSIDRAGANLYPYMTLSKRDLKTDATGNYTVGSWEAKVGALSDPNNPASGALAGAMLVELDKDNRYGKVNLITRDITNNGTTARLEMDNNGFALSHGGKKLEYANGMLRLAGNRVYDQSFPPTAAECGAAPDGFGLGNPVGVRAPNDDLNDITAPGFFVAGANTANTPFTNGPSGSMIIHEQWSSSAAAQTFKSYTSNRVYVRRKYLNEWQPWFELYSTERKPTPADISAVARSEVNFELTGGWPTIVNKIARVKSDGVMEIGKYLDFHDTNSATDYDVRISVAGNDMTLQAHQVLFSGSAFMNGSLQVGTSAKVGGYINNEKAADNILFELTQTGHSAAMMYKPKDRAALRFCGSNGFGGELAPWLEMGAGGVTTIGNVPLKDNGSWVYSAGNQPHNTHNHTAAQGNNDVIAGGYQNVGAYVMAAAVLGSGQLTHGQNIAGSNLRPGSATEYGYSGYALPGTWKCMGDIAASNADDRLDDRTTLWLRVA